MNFQWRNRNLSGLCWEDGQRSLGLEWHEGQNCFRRKKALTAETERHVTDRWAFSSSSCLWGLVWTGVSWARPARARSSAYTRASDPSPQTYPWIAAQSTAVCQQTHLGASPRHHCPLHQCFIFSYTALLMLLLLVNNKYEPNNAKQKCLHYLSFYDFMQNM